MAADVHPELTERRSDYPILARTTYFASHTLGPMHRGTRDSLQRYADEWATDGVVAWNDWMPELRRVADLVGSIIGAPPGSMVMRQNVADALAAAASALDFPTARNRVVYAADVEWPGSHYFWREHRRLGAEVEPVRMSDDGISADPQRLADAIDERTAVVYCSAVLFRTATLVDVRPIVARAHEVGALVVLDAYQGAGIVPIDVAALDVDVCVGGSVKYLCGGPGAGWLYVKPETAERLRPRVVSWFGHARPFDFAFADVEYAPGVARFTGGTPNVPAAYAAAPGYTAIAEIGVQKIRERSVSLTQPMLERAHEHGWVVRNPHDPARRGGHLTIDPGGATEPGGGLAQQVHDELIARKYVVDFRPGAGIRLAPHFFTTVEECEAILDEMAEVVDALTGGRRTG